MVPAQLGHSKWAHRRAAYHSCELVRIWLSSLQLPQLFTWSCYPPVRSMQALCGLLCRANTFGTDRQSSRLSAVHVVAAIWV